ncbi:S1 family peptidase [Brucella intermedia]|uniref:S1 family peptidase n=1 Tax=Brucella intermedia TaxID=94625 RepID=UPI00158FF4AE|nr:serine protease [Brucella intermedia]
MEGFLKRTAAGGVIALMIVGAAATVANTYRAKSAPDEDQIAETIRLSAPYEDLRAGFTVKIETESGHGSGFHIGDGFIVTAAHVLKSAKKITIKSDDGDTRDGEILWVNETRDIGLVRVENPYRLKTANLSCRTPAANESISAPGNPMGLEFVTSHGHVAGTARQAGFWKSVFVTDMTVVPGQSGGPVVAANGDVVGVTVGVALFPLGFSASLTGFGYAVPALEVCNLLARK